MQQKASYLSEALTTAHKLESKELKKLNNKRNYLIVKRLIDIIFSVIGLVISVPLIIFFGVLIKVETPGPVFYTQERVGLNGKLFNVIKLRSMVNDAERNGAQWAQKNDPRVTKVGHFIRKTRIDELPQFINILKGDMSLVGPRPERPNFTIQFNQQIPGFITRLSIKPGLTGLAQVNGGYDISPKEKFELDRQYIENLGLITDLKIILKTVAVCFNGNGAR
ncbi:sugar transferase [Siminovitchia terrae]|uniref:Sugar transferase n=1 Tax=Siminovitchia terrae TaxID=1914933 RepID=A0A429X7Z6_SIMTE|nr:sugar transferase [Siminovitchia terrae]RST59496.1 sugar transferase [Siminovitchia terrae]